MEVRQNIAYAGPLHEQVYRILRTRILAAEWDDLRPLPGEGELARELRVSIGTVRKAMDQLSRDQLVVRQRGRGTFIRDGGRYSHPSGFSLFTNDGQRVEPTIVLTGARAVPATSEQIAELRMERRAGGSPRVFQISRSWTWQDQPVCDELITVDATRFPGLPQAMTATAETLHATYADVYRTKVDRLIWSFGRREYAPDRRAHELQLAVTRIALDNRSMPLELTELHVNFALCSVKFGVPGG